MKFIHPEAGSALKQPPPQMQQPQAPGMPEMSPNGQSEEAGSHQAHSDKVGRNDACPCGSGKKYKKCGMLNTQEHINLIAKK
jgi:preprotein translocase subunit SecA